MGIFVEQTWILQPFFLVHGNHETNSDGVENSSTKKSARPLGCWQQGSPIPPLGSMISQVNGYSDALAQMIRIEIYVTAKKGIYIYIICI